MGKTIFAQLPARVQNTLATTAGIVLGDFNPQAPGEKETIRQSILFATNGGVNITCKAELKDNGEGIDNCPPDTKELLDIAKYECLMTGVAVTLTKENAADRFGSATSADGSGLTTITPDMEVEDTDFKPKWYVCPYGKDGGFVAVKLDNAYSTGGFSMQSEDKGKGQFAFEYKAFSTLENPDVVPFTFYLKETAAAAAVEVKMAA